MKIIGLRPLCHSKASRLHQDFRPLAPQSLSSVDKSLRVFAEDDVFPVAAIIASADAVYVPPASGDRTAEIGYRRSRECAVPCLENDFVERAEQSFCH